MGFLFTIWVYLVVLAAVFFCVSLGAEQDE